MSVTDNAGRGPGSRSQRVEIFDQAIVEGKSQAESLRQTYPHSAKWKESAVHQRASRMAKGVKVQSRVAELLHRPQHVWGRSGEGDEPACTRYESSRRNVPGL